MKQVKVEDVIATLINCSGCGGEVLEDDINYVTYSIKKFGVVVDAIFSKKKCSHCGRSERQVACPIELSVVERKYLWGTYETHRRAN